MIEVNIVEHKELWIEYKEKKSQDAREKLILEYLPLVKYIAQRTAINLPSHIIIEDIINDGLLGLIQAIDGYNINRGIEFRTYASFRIKGAILDALRSFDWAPRSLRKKSREIEKAFATLESDLGRPALLTEVASHLDLTQEELDKLLNKIRGLAVISLDDFVCKEQENTTLIDIYNDKNQILPEGLLEKKELIETLGRFIEELPYKEKLVITLYYYEELNLKEIAHIMELSESRMSQLHTKAILRIKGKLKQYLYAEDISSKNNKEYALI